MKRGRLMVGLGASVLIAAAGGHAARKDTYAMIDRCLADPSASWNYRTASCDAAPSGPVDRLLVEKSRHWLTAYRDGQVVREFRVSLGRGGLQPKQRAGDERVPEGRYAISAHNPTSAYHLALRISYPTPEQVADAARLGVRAGGDIMIHGLPNGRGWIGSRHRKMDWTLGCIAVTDPEMDWLFNAVPDGTPIEIRA